MILDDDWYEYAYDNCKYLYIIILKMKITEKWLEAYQISRRLILEMKMNTISIFLTILTKDRINDMIEW